ncbi:MAG: hypothetical protein K2Q26_02650 [Bdellovibrionales bacterium]|nr:hypothetical protein [Bdellovibrionales bacterium]
MKILVLALSILAINMTANAAPGRNDRPETNPRVVEAGRGLRSTLKGLGINEKLAEKLEKSGLIEPMKTLAKVLDANKKTIQEKAEIRDIVERSLNLAELSVIKTSVEAEGSQISNSGRQLVEASQTMMVNVLKMVVEDAAKATESKVDLDKVKSAIDILSRVSELELKDETLAKLKVDELTKVLGIDNLAKLIEWCKQQLAM